MPASCFLKAALTGVCHCNFRPTGLDTSQGMVFNSVSKTLSFASKHANVEQSDPPVLLITKVYGGMQHWIALIQQSVSFETEVKTPLLQAVSNSICREIFSLTCGPEGNHTTSIAIHFAPMVKNTITGHTMNRSQFRADYCREFQCSCVFAFSTKLKCSQSEQKTKNHHGRTISIPHVSNCAPERTL